jgi:hypothetical protein
MASLEQKPSVAGGGGGGEGGGGGGLDEDESRKRLEAAEKEGKAQENIAQMLRKALAASQVEATHTIQFCDRISRSQSFQHIN